MLAGVVFALAAGLMWGMIFVGPLFIPDYPGTLQSAGRYVAFGLVVLPLAWLSRRRLKRLAREDWIEAIKLSLIGNLLYYACLASAIQRTGAPVSTMIIGTLPVVITVTANLCYGHLEGRLSPEQLEFVKEELRAQLQSDPVLIELVRRATGQSPEAPAS